MNTLPSTLSPVPFLRRMPWHTHECSQCKGVMEKTRNWCKRNPEYYPGANANVSSIIVCLSFRCHNCGRKETWENFDPNAQYGDRKPSKVVKGKTYWPDNSVA